MSAGLLVDLLVGFFIGVGAALVWAACSPPVSIQTPAERQLPAEVQAVLRRLDHGAELVGLLMRELLRSGK